MAFDKKSVVVKVPAGVKKGVVNVNYADNQFSILINGVVCWQVHTEGGGNINTNVSFDIADQGVTTLTLLGANGDGPAHFESQLRIDGLSFDVESYNDSTIGSGVVWWKTYFLFHEDDVQLPR